MARKKKTEPVEVITEPQVVRGSHLTVTTYPDGRVDTEWDWEQLAEDIDRAIREYGNNQTSTKIDHEVEPVSKVSSRRSSTVKSRKKKENNSV